MYKCCECGKTSTFEEIAGMSKEEYMKLGEMRAEVKFRCPQCIGRTFDKTRPETRRTVKAR